MTKRFFGASILTLAAMCAALTGCPDHTPETGGGGVGGSPAPVSTSKGTGGGATMVCGDASQCPPPADPLCYEATCDGTCHVWPKGKGAVCGTGMSCDGSGACKPNPDGGACTGCIDTMGACVSGETYLACGGSGNACEVCDMTPVPCAIHFCKGGVGCQVQWIDEGMPCYGTGVCHAGVCVMTDGGAP